MYIFMTSINIGISSTPVIPQRNFLMKMERLTNFSYRRQFNLLLLNSFLLIPLANLSNHSGTLIEDERMIGMATDHVPTFIRFSEGEPADWVRDQSGPESGVADIRRWAKITFPEGKDSKEEEIQDLIHEAAEAARDDYGIDSANSWAGGYKFPEEYVTSDVKLIRSQMLNFTGMVRRKLLQLSHDRLSKERVERLRADNPKRVLMIELVGGMKVHRTKGFTLNGSLPRTTLRSTYIFERQPSIKLALHILLDVEVIEMSFEIVPKFQHVVLCGLLHVRGDWVTP